MRLTFARKIRHKLSVDFWEEAVGFYLDGASFAHKMNLFYQARAVAQCMAAIVSGKGENAVEQCHGRINVQRFSSFVCGYFASMFK